MAQTDPHPDQAVAFQGEGEVVYAISIQIICWANILHVHLLPAHYVGLAFSWPTCNSQIFIDSRFQRNGEAIVDLDQGLDWAWGIDNIKFARLPSTARLAGLI